MKCIVCHYGEIALKGKNRRFFEERLVVNLSNVLPDAKISAPRGRIVILSKENDITEKIKKIPGIAYFFVAKVVSSDIDKITKEAVGIMKSKKFDSFRVTVKRSDKSFSMSSADFAGHVGAAIQDKTKKKVDLSSPDIICFIEITTTETYIYCEKIKGVGGLPVGTGGKSVALISGGIDSPVASFRLIKRGVKNVFVHFHAYPTTSKQSQEKVQRIVQKLSAFQGKSILYLVPFDNIQKEILLNTKDAVRVTLYRRFMIKIAEKIAYKEKAQVLTVGESLGQVASQTMENMIITDNATTLPIFRPLIGYDKEEIINEAKYIDTYDVSILPEEDCCVRFLPKKPQTKGNIAEINEEEQKLEKEKLIEEAMKNATKEVII